MAFQVLDNLHFSLFNVRLSPMADNPSEMQAIVKMLGSNPNVLYGYPFEFNIVTTGKLKYLAGSESAMGAFIMDLKPEQSAGQLRDVAL